MKDVTKFCAILTIALGSHMLYAHTTANDVPEAPVAEEYLEDNKAWPGMFFTSASVVEEYEYDDTYCLLYDDADANMFNVEICVDLETYQLVIDAIKNDRELVGKLVLNEDYTTEELQVFTYMTDPEFEMAEASAKL